MTNWILIDRLAAKAISPFAKVLTYGKHIQLKSGIEITVLLDRCRLVSITPTSSTSEIVQILDIDDRDESHIGSVDWFKTSDLVEAVRVYRNCRSVSRIGVPTADINVVQVREILLNHQLKTIAAIIKNDPPPIPASVLMSPDTIKIFDGMAQILKSTPIMVRTSYLNGWALFGFTSVIGQATIVACLAVTNLHQERR